MTEQELLKLKSEVKTMLHSLTNCQQAVLGFFELGEYRKAYIICLECRSEYASLAAKMSELDNENPRE